MTPTSTACVTLETLGAGVVHAPADQRHGQPQEDQEDPVLPHLGHNVAPYAGQTIWEKIDDFSSIHLSGYITPATCQKASEGTTYVIPGESLCCGSSATRHSELVSSVGCHCCSSSCSCSRCYRNDPNNICVCMCVCVCVCTHTQLKKFFFPEQYVKDLKKTTTF